MSVTPVFYVASLVAGFSYDISAFGLSAEGMNSHLPLATYLTAMLTLSGIVAYGILWGKSWTIKVGLVYGFLATLTSFYATSIMLQSDGFHLSLDPFFLIPFIWILWKKRKQWDEYPPSPTHPSSIHGDPAKLSSH